MGCVKVVMPNGQEFEGHLIEQRTYVRLRDIVEALGCVVSWQDWLAVVKRAPRPITLDVDLRLPSNAAAEQLDKYLSGTPLTGLGTAFVRAEEKWRVNAVFVCAVACHESDFGRSQIARDKKNLFGYMAYDHDPYNSAKAYTSYDASIDDFCMLMSRHYLNPGGTYFNGPTIAGVSKRYSTDPQWGNKVLKHCQAILSLA